MKSTVSRMSIRILHIMKLFAYYRQNSLLFRPNGRRFESHSNLHVTT